PNIQKIRVKDAAGTPKRQYVCTRCLKSNKVAKAV
ncbi:MAG TPA: L28 family ribosomal protein, partial [Candidatus Sumerlaeota bacterium]|nr:L28 family ribosomal protein [Candidatus Sumerlaeota bacterium]